jgi:hypothetical protein
MDETTHLALRPHPTARQLARHPRALGTNGPEGTTPRGWIVVVHAVRVLIALLLVEEFVF